jgi:hypothetical protein
MRKDQNSCPMSASITLQKYFGENRSRLLDIAAYLDRIDRSTEPQSVTSDFRLIAFKKALEVLVDYSGNRVEKVQEILSDPTLDLIEIPEGIKEGAKSAFGAFMGRSNSKCC